MLKSIFANLNSSGYVYDYSDEHREVLCQRGRGQSKWEKVDIHFFVLTD